jgi:hypothetical protein
VQRRAADSLLGGDDESHFFSLRALIPSEDEVRSVSLPTREQEEENSKVKE